ncbi:DUF4192 domain-containing protein [Streptomyces aurantiogriseus]|uniref:DUF4192 domain-containing protein n=1 Tax=Streptomyces aurantiogriseus TaxID=66870 RepID=A0A918CHB1_9ACTN|nr:DUF4192 domain-containing protein [Streptomyces aurantiogriseus]GGR23891.1 hypothetical protein GCM10010251_44960 [Streptomyces aurantiogriseus]
MSNHSETTGSFENGDITGRDGCDGPASYDAAAAYEGHVPYDERAPYTGGPAAHQVTLRTPAELADALPYLLGYRPEDSIVLVALHDLGGRGRFGGRARLGIPAHPDDWGAVARQLAQGLVTGSERRGARPAQMVAYLCQEPAKGEMGRQVMERLQPLAQQLRVECGRLDVPVIEALCISDGRFWSYCCGGEGCCPDEGVPMGLPGTSVLAAAATYAGIQVRGTLRELRARLLPLETGPALEQEVALDTASRALVPRILDDDSRAAVAEETVELAGRVLRRFAEAPHVTGVLMADHRDDQLLAPDEAAALILGLQDRVTRDRAAEWMEGDEAAPALRLWRALARRCVGPYGEHAAAPLTLAGWVAWSSGDELEAREALAMALGADPGYLFARLLHQACNEGLDPESVRRCLRAEREGRGRRAEAGGERSPDVEPDVESGEGKEQREGAARAVRLEGADRGDQGDGLRDADRPDAATEAEEPDPRSTTAREAEPTPAPAAGRRRRRTRSSGAPGGGLPRAEAGERPESRADTLRPRRPRGTHPVVSGRGESRPPTRAAGKAATSRRGSCSESVQPDGDEVREKG